MGTEVSSPRTSGAAPVPAVDEGGAAVRPVPDPRAAARTGEVERGPVRGPAPGVDGPGPGTDRSPRWHGTRESLRGYLREARRLWRDFTGESAYDRYVERHAREHPDHEPMTERQFWRARADFEEGNVSTGCC